jgi:DNA invertase Pin-like site-specific DNA recombinase
MSKSRVPKKDLKTMVAKNVEDCKIIAQSYINQWKPTNPSWQTIHGAVYLRLSTDMQVSVEKGSLEQQIYIAISEAESRSATERLNYKITNFYIEPGITGRHDRRPEFAKMQRDIANKRHQFIIFKELARIARDSVLWKNFFRACIENECAVCIRGFPINPNDPSQLFLIDILAAAAEYESNLTAKRVRENVFFAMKTSGKFNSTHSLLGFNPLVINGDPKVGFYSINADEIKIVQWMMEEFCRLASYECLVVACEKRGIVNKNSEPWVAQNLRHMLTNKRYIGKWVVNAENKDKDPRRLMPYEQFLEVDLPHGLAVPLDLWNRVQKTVIQVSKNRIMDKATRRTYPLSPLLRGEDGSTFGGQGAWSPSKEKHLYYWNQKQGVRISAETLEEEAAEILAKIVRNSKEFSDALTRRGAQKSRALDELDTQIQAVSKKMVEMGDERGKLDRRLDFLLSAAQAEQVADFKEEYMTKIVHLDRERKRFQIQLEELQGQRRDIARTDFDVKRAMQTALNAQDENQAKQALKLRAIYQQLFDRIVVGAEKSDGSRTLEFVLKDENLPGFTLGESPKGGVRKLDDENCICINLVDLNGFEPMTSSLQS